MPITPQELVDHADKILNDSSSEVAYRTAVSKSYYAMYHSVLDILENKPPQYNGQGVHASLISYLASHDVKTSETHDANTLKSLSYILAQYKSKRALADYQLLDTVTEAHAIESLNAAKKLKSRCDSLTT
ncbi:hypothetical protein [Vibrio sp. 10N.261.55.A7]|uniref:hypothetical protein n=1 Tax=Vibrio sp. 10N.261.55.A7 TaxID=1880851 RepID=UPI000C85D310|nr:hypothetical protein [Vibrio sp. 10N.261.55.A7]PMJ92843.1 hypothetical protein BCU12_06795 [Vibrio sp. 10N.261.55.A7]